MKMNRPALSVAIVLSTTCKILAAAPPEQVAMAPAEADFFTDLPVVLSVSRLAQPVREAPGAVTVIDAEMIRQSGARSLAEVLRLVPGFVVAEYQHGAPVAIYHGLTTDAAGSMQVLVDGRSQYSPLWFGGVNFNTLQVSLADIERIEVLRGSNSAAFGANAVRGVVNIITYSPTQTQGSRVAVAAGNRGTQEVYARHGWRSGAAAFRISAEESRTDGLDHLHDFRIQQRAAFRGEFQADPFTRLDVILGAAAVKQGDGDTVESGTHPNPALTRWTLDNPERNRYIQSYYGQIEWIRDLGEGNEIKARYFRVQENGSMAYRAQFDELDLAPPGFGQDGLVDFVGSFDYRPHIVRDDIEVQHTLSIDQSRLVWGLGARNDRVDFAQVYGTQTPITNQIGRIFGNWEWRMRPDLLMNLGATYEYDTITKNTMSPRLMFNWLATPTQTWRAGVSRAYRTPALSEQRADSKITATDTSPLNQGTVIVQEALSVRTLKPEEMTTYEVSYLGEWKERGLLVDARAFREEVRDRVLGYPTDPNTTPALCSIICTNVWANAQDVNITGIEGQLRWEPSRKTRFMVNHAVIQITPKSHPTDNNDLGFGPPVHASDKAGDADRHARRSAPSNQTSLHWVQLLPAGFESSLAYYRVPYYKWTNHTEVPAYERIDWRLGYPFRIGNDKAELALTVRAIGAGHSEYRRNSDPRPYLSNHMIYPVAFVSFRVDF